MTRKNQQPRQPADEVFRALVRTMGLIRHVLRPHFDRHEIGRAQFMVLAALRQASENGRESLTFGELSERMIVRPPSMTGVIRKLQELGFVEVNRSERDARSRDVSLSERGREQIESMLDTHAREVGKLTVCLSVEEQRSLVGLLGRLSDHMLMIQTSGSGQAPVGGGKTEGDEKKSKGNRKSRAGLPDAGKKP